MSDAQVTSFTVRSLLGDASRYLIPMYQRNYAWERVRSLNLCRTYSTTSKKPS